MLLVEAEEPDEAEVTPSSQDREEPADDCLEVVQCGGDDDSVALTRADTEVLAFAEAVVTTPEGLKAAADVSHDSTRTLADRF